MPEGPTLANRLGEAPKALKRRLASPIWLFPRGTKPPHLTSPEPPLPHNLRPSVEPSPPPLDRVGPPPPPPPPPQGGDYHDAVVVGSVETPRAPPSPPPKKAPPPLAAGGQGGTYASYCVEVAKSAWPWPRLVMMVVTFVVTIKATKAKEEPERRSWLKEGVRLVLVLRVNGILRLRSASPDPVMSFVAPPPALRRVLVGLLEVGLLVSVARSNREAETRHVSLGRR